MSQTRNPASFRPLFAADTRPAAAPPRRIWVPAEHEGWLRKLEVPGLKPSDIRPYRDFRGDILSGAGGAPQLLLIRSRDWNTAPSRVVAALEKATPSRALVVRGLGESIVAAAQPGLWEVIDPQGQPEERILRLGHALGELDREIAARDTISDAEYWRTYVDELNQIGVALSTERDLQKLLDLIVLTARRLIKADAGSLYLVTDDPAAKGPPTNDLLKKKMRFEVAQNDSVEFAFKSAVLDVSKKTLYGYSALTQETVLLHDAYSIPPEAEYSWGGRGWDTAMGYRTKAMLTVPLVDWSQKTIGVLQLINRKRDHGVRLGAASSETEFLPFDERDVRLAHSVASQASIAIQNALLVESVRSHLQGLVSASEDRFRNLIEGSIQGVAIYRDLIPLFANQAYAQILGYGSVQEFQDQFSFEQRFPVEEAVRLVKAQRAAGGSDGAKQQTYEVQAVRKEGQPVWLATIARVVRWENGPAVQVTVSEITRRKAAEMKLKASEERFRNLVEGSIQGIVIHREGRILFANDAMARIFGFQAPADLMDVRAWPDLIVPDDRERVAVYHAARLRGAVAPSRYEFQGSHFNAAALHLEVAERVVDWDGQPAIQGIVNDITERKRSEAVRLELERQIQHRQKLESLGVLAGGLAHDFNNILTGILGNAELAATEFPEDSKARGYLQVIHSASQRASKLTRQMLAYAGKGKVRVEPVGLNELIRAIRDLLVAAIPKQVDLRTQLDGNLPPVDADSAQMEQVIMNLITNGAEAIGEAPGTVTVVTEERDLTPDAIAKLRLKRPLEPGRYVCLTVTDTGCGMSEEVKARIFEPFFSTKVTGRGLGLSAVLGIVRGHRGAIDVESKPGVGTTIRVYLPLSAADDAHLAHEAEAAPDVLLERLVRGKVLVADDEPIVREVLSGMLTNLGYTVTLATHGQEAIAQLEQNPAGYQALFLDMTMPGYSPEETLRRVRSIRADLPIVLCSGYGGEEAMRRMPGFDFGAFLPKPFVLDQVIRALHSALVR